MSADKMTAEDAVNVLKYLESVGSGMDPHDKGREALFRAANHLGEEVRRMANVVERDDGGPIQQMSLRDQFATAVMNALVCASVQRNGARVFLHENSGPDMAASAFSMADDMLRARRV